MITAAQLKDIKERTEALNRYLDIVLAKYDGTSFSKSLGTVVAERLIDTLCVSLITGVTLITVSYTHLDVYKRQHSPSEK